jgi:predicted enzyme related to lactoylglutathione lyase
MRLKAKLIAVNIPTRNQDASNAFYAKLLGIDLARSFTEATRSYHAPLTQSGEWLWVSARNANDEATLAVFAVDNLDQTVRDLVAAGGQSVLGPISPPISPKLYPEYSKGRSAKGGHPSQTLGRFQMVKDPDGNVIMLAELDKDAQASFKAGPHDPGLSQEQVDQHQKTKQAGSALPK